MCHTRGLSPPYAGTVPTEFPELGTVPSNQELGTVLSNQGVCPRRFGFVGTVPAGFQMFTNHKWQKFVLVAIVNN